MQARICKQCLLRDMPEEELLKGIYDYIARISPDDKVDDQIYEKRLTICQNCDSLANGFCRLCGCFVEMRAAMKIRSCPHVPPRWKKHEE